MFDKKALLTRTLLPILVLAGCQATPAGTDDGPPPTERSPDRMTVARELHLRAVDGDLDAAGRALALLEDLEARRPDDPLVEAYLGSARLLEADRARLPWRKGALALEGLERLDAAVGARPDDLEIRFLRGASTLPLPAAFERLDQARADLDLVARARPETVDDRFRAAARRLMAKERTP